MNIPKIIMGVQKVRKQHVKAKNICDEVNESGRLN